MTAICLDWTPSELLATQTRAWHSFIRYGARFRRLVVDAWADMHRTELALRDPPIVLEPDEVLAPGQFEQQKRRLYEEGFAARYGRYPCTTIPIVDDFDATMPRRKNNHG